VDVEPLFQSGGVAVTRWRCRVREVGGTARLCHRWYVLTFVHTGAFQAHLSEGPVLLDSMRALLGVPEESFLVTRQFGPAVTGSAICISPTLMPEVEEGEGRRGSTRLLRAEVRPRALLAQHLILRQIEEGASSLAIEELGLALAMEGFHEPRLVPHGRRRKSSRGRDIVGMAQAILAANYEKPVRLETIARAVEASPFYLCRTFKQIVGVNMHQYLNRLRLRAALEHVAERRLALTEIAYGHGFSSQSHFAEAFRKEFRVTPSEVRRLAARQIGDMSRALDLVLQ
jgi:AraC-like DNA-binding protein